jgi:hypothetical protein
MAISFEHMPKTYAAACTWTRGFIGKRPFSLMRETSSGDMCRGVPTPGKQPLQSLEKPKIPNPGAVGSNPAGDTSRTGCEA